MFYPVILTTMTISAILMIGAPSYVIPQNRTRKEIEQITVSAYCHAQVHSNVLSEINNSGSSAENC